MLNDHAKAALRVGAELFENSPATNIKSGKPATISTPKGKVIAKNVCIATNAYTPRLGYASFDSTEWEDKAGAQNLVRRMLEQRYPQMADIGLVHGWHGVTGHTALMKPIAGPVCDGNIHVSVAYNGLGAMPAHNNGYLTACRITGNEDRDLHFLPGVGGQAPMPGDFYRNLMLKPFMHLLQPV